MKEIIITAISLVVGAFLGSYLNWGIEKKKHRLAYRKELVGKWREMLSQLLINPPTNQAIPPKYTLSKLDGYMTLKHHLTPYAVDLIERAPHWKDAIGLYVIQTIEEEVSVI